jgi:hypothetical protein
LARDNAFKESEPLTDAGERFRILPLEPIGGNRNDS